MIKSIRASLRDNLSLSLPSSPFGDRVQNLRDIQLEHGITATEHEGYKANTSLSPLPLRRIPNDVHDSYNVETGKHMKRISDEVILDGNLEWVALLDVVDDDTYRMKVNNWTVDKNVLQATANSGIGYSNDGDYPLTYNAVFDQRLIAFNIDRLQVRIEKIKVDAQAGATTEDKFKTYLNTYPVTLYYQLETPAVSYHDPELTFNGVPYPHLRAFEGSNTIVAGTEGVLPLTSLGYASDSDILEYDPQKIWNLHPRANPPVFSRASEAYIGEEVIDINTPRFKDGGMLIEEGTENVFDSPNARKFDRSKIKGYGNVIHLGDGVVDGQLSVAQFGETRTEIIPTSQDDWEQGSITGSDGTSVSSTTRIRTKGFFSVTPNTSYEVAIEGEFETAIAYYTEAEEYISFQSGGNWLPSGTAITAPATATKARAVLRKIDNSTFLASELPKYWFSKEGDRNYHFITGTKSTLPVIQVSVGKNLFDKSKTLYDRSLQSDGNSVTVVGNYSHSDYTMIASGQSYMIQGRTQTALAVYDKHKNFTRYLSGSGANSFTSTAGEVYVRFNMHPDDVEFVQLEQGSVATPYVPHASTKSLATWGEAGEGRSLPNGTKDEFRDGMLTKRVSDDTTLQHAWFTKGTTNNPVGYDMYWAQNLFTTRGLTSGDLDKNTKSSRLFVDGVEQNFVLGGWAFLTNTNQYAQEALNNGIIEMLVPTGTLFTDFYAGKLISLSYQLAEPVITEHEIEITDQDGNVVPEMKTFEKGTVYFKLPEGVNPEDTTAGEKVIHYTSEAPEEVISLPAGTYTFSNQGEVEDSITLQRAGEDDLLIPKDGAETITLASTTEVTLKGNGAEYVQIEQKAYKTSWLLPGKIRANENFIIPTQGVITPTEGTIDIRCYIGAHQLRNEGWNKIFALVRLGGNPGIRVENHSSSPGMFILGTSNDAGTTTAQSFPKELIPNGIVHFRIRFKADIIECLVNNSIVATINNPNLPSAFGSSFRLGQSGATAYLNAYFHEVAISSIYREDEVPLGEPFTIDRHTTYHMPLDTDLSHYHRNFANLGSTPGKDINDPLWIENSLLFSGNQFVPMPVPFDVNGDWTVYIVAKRNGVPDEVEYLWALGNLNNSTPILALYKQSNGYRLNLRDDTNSQKLTTLTVTSPNIYHLFAIKKIGSIYTIKSLTEDTQVSTTSLDYEYTINIATLGVLRYGTSFLGYLNGEIAYYMSYARATSDNEDNRSYRRLRQQLASRGVTI